MTGSRPAVIRHGSAGGSDASDTISQGCVPIVAITLKRPRAARSTTSSIPVSVVAGSLRISYVVRVAAEADDRDDDDEDEDEGVEEREKSEGSSTIKSRFWSNTYLGIHRVGVHER
jgi:hypothetical protein